MKFNQTIYKILNRSKTHDMEKIKKKKKKN